MSQSQRRDEHLSVSAIERPLGVQRSGKAAPQLGRVLWIIIAVSLGVHVVCLIAGSTWLEDWRWPHHPVHAAVEMAGALVAFLVALWLLSRLMDYRQRRGPRHSRLGLFLSLCKAHELEWFQWWLLWRVARRHRLRDPARVFLEPDRLLLAKLGRGFRFHQERLQVLTERLFAGLPREGAKPSNTAAAQKKPEGTAEATPSVS